MRSSVVQVRRTVSADQRFVVVGSGSAGRRHALSLRSLFPSASIVVVKRSGSTQPLKQLEEQNISIVGSLIEASRTVPTFCAIASPATLHLSDLEVLSRTCTTFLLEKPIAANADEGRRLVELASSRDLRVTVGHHLRFSETPLAFSDQIGKLSPNEVCSFRLSYGQHLRHWRPGVDAERTVTARQELGGGVIRELSHEIDGAWLLGGPFREVSRAHLARTGAPTDGLVDTVADFTLQGTNLAIDVHLDMTTDLPYRRWEAILRDQTIRADLLEGMVSRVSPDGQLTVIHKSGPDERDRAGQALIRSALGLDDLDSKQACDIHQGLRLLNTIEAIEESAASGRPAAIRD